MNKCKLTRHAAAVVVLTLLSGFGQRVLAYTPGACREDAAKLCPGLTTDKEAIPCLREHSANLSMPCKVNLAEGREMVRQIGDACEPDILKFCAGVQKGQGRIRKCLKAHQAELTAGCKSQIAAVRQKYQMDASTAAIK